MDDPTGLWEWTAGDIFKPHRQGIAFEIETNEADGVLWLSYRYREEPIEYDIPLLTRAGPFGGKRWYWGCPIFGHEQRGHYKHCTRLYRLGKYSKCMHYLRLCYKSQNEGKKLERWGWRFGIDLQALEGSMAERSGWYKGC